STTVSHLSTKSGISQQGSSDQDAKLPLTCEAAERALRATPPLCPDNMRSRFVGECFACPMASGAIEATSA
ncbi:MAG TPA: hypothetical protein VN277_02800, partial [Acidiferrobacterales bacterium]|nr:hypothetical protein [Acidiferrobacterales bacterium]